MLIYQNARIFPLKRTACLFGWLVRVFSAHVVPLRRLAYSSMYSIHKTRFSPREPGANLRRLACCVITSGDAHCVTFFRACTSVVHVWMERPGYCCCCRRHRDTQQCTFKISTKRMKAHARTCFDQSAKISERERKVRMYSKVPKNISVEGSTYCCRQQQ